LKTESFAFFRQFLF